MNKTYYVTQKLTTKGWVTIAVHFLRLAAWWFERKYLKDNKGVALRRLKSNYK